MNAIDRTAPVLVEPQRHFSASPADVWAEIAGDEATTRTFKHEAARGSGHYYRDHCIAFDHLRACWRWLGLHESVLPNTCG